jgi:hypothetical protein
MFSREAQRWSSGFSLRKWGLPAELAVSGLRQKRSITVNLRRLRPELQHAGSRVMIDFGIGISDFGFTKNAGSLV